MKRFLSTFGICLALVEAFIFFGGYQLFDFSRRWYLAGASIALVLAVLVGATAIVGTISKNAADQEDETQTVFSLDPENVTNLGWDYSEKVSFTAGEDGWVCDQDGAFPVDETCLDKMLEVLTDVESAKTIENPENLDQYGLEIPVCVITVEDGQSHTLSIGLETAVGGQRYFSNGDGNVYLVDKDIIENFRYGLYDVLKHQTLPEAELPLTLTSYSPCFRKEKGAHGIEERGVYRIHQFEKQEMIVVCKPEESMDWFHKMYGYTVEFFRSLDIPVRTLECCSGDLADLKVKSLDVEAWSPRQKKYFEVGSCSNLGDAQARRLGIRIKGKDGNKYFAHTLNNTVVAPPRMLIAFLENNLNEDGSVRIPEPLQRYMFTDCIRPQD